MGWLEWSVWIAAMVLGLVVGWIVAETGRSIVRAFRRGVAEAKSEKEKRR